MRGIGLNLTGSTRAQQKHSKLQGARCKVLTFKNQFTRKKVLVCFPFVRGSSLQRWVNVNVLMFPHFGSVWLCIYIELERDGASHQNLKYLRGTKLQGCEFKCPILTPCQSILICHFSRSSSNP